MWGRQLRISQREVSGREIEGCIGIDVLCFLYVVLCCVEEQCLFGDEAEAGRS